MEIHIALLRHIMIIYTLVRIACLSYKFFDDLLCVPDRLSGWSILHSIKRYQLART